MLKLCFKPGSKKTLQQMFDRINWGVCDQVTRSDVTEDNGEYSGAFGGRVPHLCLPEDAGVDLDNPPHPLFCQQGDVSSFSNDNSFMIHSLMFMAFKPLILGSKYWIQVLDPMVRYLLIFTFLCSRAIRVLISWNMPIQCFYVIHKD